MRPIPDAAVACVAVHEGCKLKAYQDVADPPVWTIGYGSTAGVAKGLVITQAQAAAKLKTDLFVAAARIYARIGAVADELTENQYAALLSFVFNVGAAPGWTIWKRLKARQFDQIPLELMKFCNAGGQKVQGLVNRRADECKLWATGEPNVIERVIPSSVTRDIVTPPTPADPHPPQQSATILGGALTVAATVPVAAKQVTDAIAPYQDASPMVGQIVALVATIAAVAAVLVLVLAWLKKREARG